MTTRIVAILGLGLAIAAGISGYRIGQSLAEADCEKARLAAVERAIAQAQEQAAIDADILRAAAERQKDNEIKTRTIIKTVVKHVQSPVATPDYRACRLDACGLCLAREAAAGRDGASCPCGPDAALPSTGGSDGRDHGGAAGKLHGNGDATARLP